MFKAVKYIGVFLYHFMFIDQSTGQLSTTKFFSNVGYCIWCFLFPYVVVKNLTTNMDLWMIFGVVIIGNRTLNVLMQSKYGATQNPSQTWSAGVMAPSAPDPTVVTSTTTTTSPTVITTSVPAATTTTVSTGTSPTAPATIVVPDAPATTVTAPVMTTTAVVSSTTVPNVTDLVK